MKFYGRAYRELQAQVKAAKAPRQPRVVPLVDQIRASVAKTGEPFLAGALVAFPVHVPGKASQVWWKLRGQVVSKARAGVFLDTPAQATLARLVRRALSG